MSIDIHAHTSSHLMHGLHVKDASLAELERIATSHGVVKTLVMATYFPFKGTGLHNRELLARIAGNNHFAAIGSLDASGDVKAGIAELADLARHEQIVGLKLYPGYQPVSVADPKLWPLYELAARYELPVTIHGGSLHHCCHGQQRAQGLGPCGKKVCPLDKLEHMSHPYGLAPVFAAWPNVTFVVAHLANPYFAALREIMTAYPNVMTDISGQFVSGSSEDTLAYRAELIDELNKFVALPHGYERLMFATDFPIQSHADSKWLLEQINITLQDYTYIVSINAGRIYHLNMKELTRGKFSNF